MLKKDIVVLKNYVNGQDDLELYETCMSVYLFLEKTTAFIKFVYEYCTEEQEEDFDVEWYELRDFIGEMFYSMCKKNAIITFPNPSYFQMLFIKKGKDKNIIKKLIKTLTDEMFDAAKRLQFERAAILRDKIQELEEEI